MQARVTAVLVARNGAKYLDRTLSAIEAQSRRPDALVLVDASSNDGTAARLATAPATVRLTTSARGGFAAAVDAALRELGERANDDEWIWILAHDNAPAPAALAQLLAAAEIAPSVAVAGPKLTRWESPETIAQFGESVTPFGAAVQLVTNELDQGQHDRRDDVLAVASHGMLVRRAVFESLGGFDSKLNAAFDGLDFCIRTRLAGFRVVAVPEARVATATAEPREGVVRAAALHRRLVYAPGWALPLHWLALLPLAIVRSLWSIVAKHPLAVPGEISAAVVAAADGSVLASRLRLERSKKLPWSAIAPLRVQASQARELAANRAARGTEASASIGTRLGSSAESPRPSFFATGGAWAVLLLAVIGIISFSPLLNAAALAGGGLAPLGSLAELWHLSPTSDPFALVVAVLGSVTFWAPSLSIVALYLLALPLAGLAAWACAARFSTLGWPPIAAAVFWSLSPSFLASLHGGHLGAVIAHITLPWLVLAVVGAIRSWSAAGAAALLFAVVAASAPILAPVLLLANTAWSLAHPRSVQRTLAIPVAALVLFAPLVVAQASRGDLLSVLAEPGIPTTGATTSAWQLALGSAGGGSNGWDGVIAALGFPHAATIVVVAALLAPLAALALLAVFLPGSRRAVPLLGLALLGFVLAVASVHLQLSHAGSTAFVIWPGAALALYWLGIVGSAVLALEALGSAALLPALLASAGAIALAVPLIAAPLVGTIHVRDSDGHMLPAFVTAEATTTPRIGTLELVAQPDGSLAVTLHRGAGTTLNESSTLDSTATTLSKHDEDLANLAANLASRSGLNFEAELARFGVSFVLLPEASEGSPAAMIARTRAADALDSNGALVAIGETDFGYLWRYPGEVDLVDASESSAPWLAALAIIFGVVAVTALPTGVRRRPTSVPEVDDNPADTFEEDDSA